MRLFSSAAVLKSSFVRTTKRPFSYSYPLTSSSHATGLPSRAQTRSKRTGDLSCGVKHSEARPRIAHRRMEFDRDIDEAEGDRALPECTCHYRRRVQILTATGPNPDRAAVVSTVGLSLRGGATFSSRSASSQSSKSRPSLPPRCRYRWYAASAISS